MPRPIFVQDRHAKIAEMIRVNYAGEYGACRIYKGQINFINNKICKAQIMSMLNHEEEHCAFFAQQIQNRKIRPTFFMTLWHALGYVSGAITAITGTKLAMLYTEAVENAIDQHYQDQIRQLELIFTEREKKLITAIRRFHQEEIEHKVIAKTYYNELSRISIVFKNLVESICNVAICLSKK